jgi:type IV secretory pathway VirB10-like protein
MAQSGWGSYRRGWRTAVVILAALGLVTALVFVGWSTNVVAFLMGGTLVASVHLSVGLAQERQASDLMRDVLRFATRAGLCVVAVVGYATAIGLGTLWLLLLIGITSPPVVSWLWPQRAEAIRPADDVRRPRAEPKPEIVRKAKKQPKPDRKPRRKNNHQPPPPPEPVVLKAPEPPNLTDLSDEDLCLAWRRSFTELQACTTDEQRLAVVTARNAYLDELERRAPEAFGQWLDSGPRAAGNPAKFFSPRTNHGGPD